MKLPVVPMTLPNILSLYRLYSFPFILIFIFIGEMNLFLFFICFNLLTDVADGWIARHFNQMTEIGSKIDALADNGTYLLAMAGIFVFKWADIQPHMVSFSIFMALFLIADLAPLIKFREHGSHHTYSAKIGGYIKGTFLFVWFAWGFLEWFYYVMIITSYVSFIENITITLMLKTPETDVKGLYWVLKKRTASRDEQLNP